MPLRVAREGNVIKAVFIAAEAVTSLNAVEIDPAGGERYVKVGTDAQEPRVAGVARGTVTSGKLVRVIVAGLVSGVVCGAAVNMGDRVMLTSGGRVTPLNTITPAGAVSGYITGVSGYITNISGYVPINLQSGTIASGGVAVDTPGLVGLSGIVSGVDGAQFSSGAANFASGQALFHSGAFAGTAINTGRIVGKALTSGGLGSGIRLLVTLGG